jgi:hypothetical protein
MFEFKLSDKFAPDYLLFFDDVVRMVILQITIQFMYYMKDPYTNSFFTLELLELVLYVVMGVSVFWLLFKKMIKIT